MTSEADDISAWEQLGVQICHVCQFKTSDPSTFRTHVCRKITIRFKKPLKLYECTICKIDLNEFDFTEHLQHHLLAKPFVCNVCHRDFVNKKSVFTHLKTSHAPISHPSYGLKVDDNTDNYLETAKTRGKVLITPFRKILARESLVPAEDFYGDSDSLTSAQPSCDPIALTTPAQPSCDPIALTTPAQPSCDPIALATTLTTPVQPSCDPIALTTPAQPSSDPIALTTPAQPSSDPIALTTPAQPSCDPIALTTSTHGGACGSQSTILSSDSLTKIQHDSREGKLQPSTTEAISRSSDTGVEESQLKENLSSHERHADVKAQNATAKSADSDSRVFCKVVKHDSDSSVMLPLNNSSKDKYLFLNIFSINGEILYVCSRCQVKFKEKDPFIHHIWKKHAHLDNCSSCSSTFSLSCPHLQSVLKLLKEKSMGLFDIHSMRNQKELLVGTCSSSSTTSSAVVSHPLGLSDYLTSQDPQCIVQLKNLKQECDTPKAKIENEAASVGSKSDCYTVTSSFSSSTLEPLIVTSHDPNCILQLKKELEEQECEDESRKTSLASKTDKLVVEKPDIENKEPNIIVSKGNDKITENVLKAGSSAIEKNAVSLEGNDGSCSNDHILIEKVAAVQGSNANLFVSNSENSTSNSLTSKSEHSSERETSGLNSPASQSEESTMDWSAKRKENLSLIEVSEKSILDSQANEIEKSNLNPPTRKTEISTSISPTLNIENSNVDATSQKPENPSIASTTKKPENPSIDSTTKKPENPSIASTTKKSENPSIDSTTKKPENPSIDSTTKKPENPSIASTTKKPENPSIDSTTKKPENPSIDSTTKKPENPSIDSTTKKPENPSIDSTTKKPENPSIDSTTKKPENPSIDFTTIDSENLRFEKQINENSTKDDMIEVTRRESHISVMAHVPKICHNLAVEGETEVHSRQHNKGNSVGDGIAQEEDVSTITVPSEALDKLAVVDQADAGDIGERTPRTDELQQDGDIERRNSLMHTDQTFGEHPFPVESNVMKSIHSTETIMDIENSAIPNSGDTPNFLHQSSLETKANINVDLCKANAKDLAEEALKSSELSDRSIGKIKINALEPGNKEFATNDSDSVKVPEKTLEQKCVISENILIKTDIVNPGGNNDNRWNFYKCAFSHCNYSHSSPADFLSHFPEDHGMESSFICFYCGFEGRSTCDLIDHMDSHIGHSLDNFSGSIWENSNFYRKVEERNLNTLMNIIESKSKGIQNVEYTCNQCESKFSCLVTMKSHLEHATLKTYSCRHCRSIFLNPKSAQRHSREVHPKKPIFRRHCVKLLCGDRAKYENSYSKLVKISNFNQDTQKLYKSEEPIRLKLDDKNIGGGQEESMPQSRVLEQTETGKTTDGKEPLLEDCDSPQIKPSENAIITVNTNTSMGDSSSAEVAQHSKKEMIDKANGAQKLDKNEAPIRLKLDDNRIDGCQEESMPQSRVLEQTETGKTTDGKESLLEDCDSPQIKPSENAIITVNTNTSMGDSSSAEVAQHSKKEMNDSVSGSSPISHSNRSINEQMESHTQQENKEPENISKLLADPQNVSEKNENFPQPPNVSYIKDSTIDESKQMSRIYDVCAKKKTVRCLEGLYTKNQAMSYSCNACSKEMPSLKNMMCHIFFCQGKISVVNCPYDCSFESEHPKLLIPHMQEMHPNKDPSCKSFRCINERIFFKFLKKKKVTQTVLEMACKPVHNQKRGSTKKRKCSDVGVESYKSGKSDHPSPRPGFITTDRPAVMETQISSNTTESGSMALGRFTDTQEETNLHQVDIESKTPVSPTSSVGENSTTSSCSIAQEIVGIHSGKDKMQQVSDDSSSRPVEGENLQLVLKGKETCDNVGEVCETERDCSDSDHHLSIPGSVCKDGEVAEEIHSESSKHLHDLAGKKSQEKETDLSAMEKGLYTVIKQGSSNTAEQSLGSSTMILESSRTVCTQEENTDLLPPFNLGKTPSKMNQTHSLFDKDRIIQKSNEFAGEELPETNELAETVNITEKCVEMGISKQESSLVTESESNEEGPSSNQSKKPMNSTQSFSNKNLAYQCKLCHIVLSFNMQQMRKHITEKHNFFVCGYCEWPYSKLSHLENHTKSAHENNVLNFQQIGPELIFIRIESTTQVSNFHPVSDQLSNCQKEEMSEERSTSEQNDIHQTGIPEKEDGNVGAFKDPSVNIRQAHPVLKAKDDNCQNIDVLYCTSHPPSSAISSLTENISKTLSSVGVLDNVSKENDVLKQQQQQGLTNTSCKTFRETFDELISDGQEGRKLSFPRCQTGHGLPDGKGTGSNSLKLKIKIKRKAAEYVMEDQQEIKRLCFNPSVHEDAHTRIKEKAQVDIPMVSHAESDQQSQSIITGSPEIVYCMPGDSNLNGAMLGCQLTGKFLSCKMCMVLFASLSELRLHFKSEHPDALAHWHDLRTGADYTADREKLYGMMDVRPDVRNYLCGNCTFETKERGSLKNHMLLTHCYNDFHYVVPSCYGEPVPLVAYSEKCSVIDEETSTPGCCHEIAQTEKHRQMLSYVCHICGMSLKSEFLFRLHLAKHGGFKHCVTPATTQGLLLCATCGYVASSSNDLAAHTNRHMTERRYRCSDCDFDDHHRQGVFTHIRKYHGASSLAHLLDNNQLNKVDDFRPKLVNLQPTVCLRMLDLKRLTTDDDNFRKEASESPKS